MDWTNVLIATLGLLGGGITATLTYLYQKKQIRIERDKLRIEENKRESDSVSEIVENALKIAEQVGPLTTRISAMENERKILTGKIELLIVENKSLKGRIMLLEESLSEKPFYRGLFESTPFPCLIVNSTDGSILDSNLAFERITGVSKKDLLGTDAYNRILESSEVSKSIENEYYVQEDVHLVRLDESLVKCTMYFSHYVSEDKCTLCVFVSEKETTSKKKAMKALKKILEMYQSSYATIWAIHNHGADKVTALYEDKRKDVPYLFHGYKRIPRAIFSDLIEALKKEEFLLLTSGSTEFKTTVATFVGEGIHCMLLSGIFNTKGDIIGILSTSWMADRCDGTSHEVLVNLSKDKSVISSIEASFGI